MINQCYPKNYVEYTTSQLNISVPSNLAYGIKVVLMGGSGVGVIPSFYVVVTAPT